MRRRALAADAALGRAPIPEGHHVLTGLTVRPDTGRLGACSFDRAATRNPFETALVCLAAVVVDRAFGVDPALSSGDRADAREALAWDRPSVDVLALRLERAATDAASFVALHAPAIALVGCALVEARELPGATANVLVDAALDWLARLEPRAAEPFPLAVTARDGSRAAWPSQVAVEHAAVRSPPW